MSARKNLLPISSLLLSCVIFGSSIILAKLTFGQVAFTHVVLWRFVFASLLLLPVVLVSKARLQRRDLARFFLVGLLELPVTYLVQYAGFAHTTATHASFILGLSPCLYAVAAFLINKEILRPRSWLVAALSALGAVVIAGQPGQAGHWVGDGLVLLSLVTSVVSVMLNQRLLERYPPMVATAYVFWFGLLTLLPVVLWLDGPPPLQLPPMVWFSLFMQGTICTAVGYCLWNFGASRLQTSHVGVYANLEPVVGALLGVMVLNETLGLWSIMGGLLVIGAAIFLALTPAVQPTRRDLPASVKGKTEEAAANPWSQRLPSLRLRSTFQPVFNLWVLL